MFKPRIWELALAVLAAALLCRAARLDSPVVVAYGLAGMIFACSAIGARGARQAGRSPVEGIWLGLVLGPIGAAIAHSRPISHRRPERHGVSPADAFEHGSPGFAGPGVERPHRLPN